jgi:hypothetical protein
MATTTQAATSDGTSGENPNPLLIPLDREVCGADLALMQLKLKLSVADACHLFGQPMARWARLTKQDRDGNLPLSNKTLALLVRALDMHPEMCPILPSIEPPAIFESMGKYVQDLDKKRFAVFFGCEASSGYRWLTKGSRVTPQLAKLQSIFGRWLESAAKRGTKAASEVIKSWEAMVLAEAIVSGVGGVFATGRWTAARGTEASNEPPEGSVRRGLSVLKIGKRVSDADLQEIKKGGTPKRAKTRNTLQRELEAPARPRNTRPAAVVTKKIAAKKTTKTTVLAKAKSRTLLKRGKAKKAAVR